MTFALAEEKERNKIWPRVLAAATRNRIQGTTKSILIDSICNQTRLSDNFQVDKFTILGKMNVCRDETSRLLFLKGVEVREGETLTLPIEQCIFVPGTAHILFDGSV